MPWHPSSFPFPGISRMRREDEPEDENHGNDSLGKVVLGPVVRGHSCDIIRPKVVVSMRKRTVLLMIAVLILTFVGCRSGPMESREGNVKVTLPAPQETVTFVKQTDGSWKGSVRTTGSARAWEATVSWEAIQQLSPDLLSSLGRGYFMTSAGAPEFGTFDQILVLISAASNPVPEGKGALRIFITSMKDGSQQDVVSIPLTLRLGQ